MGPKIKPKGAQKMDTSGVIPDKKLDHCGKWKELSVV